MWKIFVHFIIRHFCVPSNWIQPAKESRYVICRMLFSSSLTSEDIAHFHVLMEVSFTSDQRVPLLSNIPTSFWPVIISVPAVQFQPGFLLSTEGINVLPRKTAFKFRKSLSEYVNLYTLTSRVLYVTSVQELQWKSGKKGKLIRIMDFSGGFLADLCPLSPSSTLTLPVADGDEKCSRLVKMHL